MAKYLAVYVGIYLLLKHGSSDLTEASAVEKLVACGTTAVNASQTHGRVVGGKDSIPGQWPWQAMVFVKETLVSQYSLRCGGTLIYPTWVVSAAHCFDSRIRSIGVYFGVTDWSSDFETTRQWHDTEFYYKHPDYSAMTFEADIALLNLRTEVVYNDYVRPACLPSVFSTLGSGEVCVVSGFGETQDTGNNDILQYAKVEIIPLSTCNAWYEEDGTRVTSDHICAGYEMGGIDTCQGDSGGPLVCDAAGAFVLHGITSFGIGCAEVRRPGAYTSVTAYLEWIKDKVSVLDTTAKTTTSTEVPYEVTQEGQLKTQSQSSVGDLSTAALATPTTTSAARRISGSVYSAIVAATFSCLLLYGDIQCFR